MDATPGQRWPDESQLPPFHRKPADPINSLQAWEAAEEAEAITPDVSLVRLQRIAVREFGDMGPAGYGEDGLTSLVAERHLPSNDSPAAPSPGSVAAGAAAWYAGRGSAPARESKMRLGPVL